MIGLDYHYLTLIKHNFCGGIDSFDMIRDSLTWSEGQLARVRDDVTGVGFEAGAAANVGNKNMLIIYNNL